MLLDTLCTAVPALAQGRDLAVTFKDMMRRRASEELDGWLERAKGSGLVGFSSFVRGIRADYAAVAASFSMVLDGVEQRTDGRPCEPFEIYQASGLWTSEF